MKKDKKVPEKQKRDGKKMLHKAELAIRSEFYLEASWILSSLLERKLKKMVENIENISTGNGFSLEQSIKRIKHLHSISKSPLFSARFEVGLIDDIRGWKNQRNTILKDMQDVHVSQARLQRLAGEGMTLLKRWNSSNKKFKTELSQTRTE